MCVPTLTNAEEELLALWLTEFKEFPLRYVEPILDSTTVDLIKYMCDSLKQDSHVFVMTVDILTNYITIMNEKKIKIEDQLLTILTIICIGSKYVGELSELKFVPVATFYRSVTDKEVKKGMLKRMEMSVLETLSEGLPVSFMIDDLKALVYLYIKKFNFNIDVTKLCVETLDVVYIYYRRLFFRLRNVYRQTAEGSEAFKRLVTNRLYFPVGILLCSFKLTKLQNVINLDNLLDELSEITEMHRNHIELLTTYILDIINRTD